MKCFKCKIDKPENEFSFKSIKKQKRQRQCKACHKLYAQKHYLKNKSTYTKKARTWRKDRRTALRLEVFRFLQNKHCIDCGETDILTLDFDHKNRKLKTENISSLIWKAVSWQTVLNEINKCDIRCANCHRRKTFKEFNYFRYAHMVELADTLDSKPNASA